MLKLCQSVFSMSVLTELFRSCESVSGGARVGSSRIGVMGVMSFVSPCMANKWYIRELASGCPFPWCPRTRRSMFTLIQRDSIVLPLGIMPHRVPARPNWASEGISSTTADWHKWIKQQQRGKFAQCNTMILVLYVCHQLLYTLLN